MFKLLSTCLQNDQLAIFKKTLQARYIECINFAVNLHKTILDKTRLMFLQFLILYTIYLQVYALY